MRVCLVATLTRTHPQHFNQLRSQAGGGNWGQSDEVVVKARNAVVVEETERAISDGCRKIMIMYGGLHMQVTTATCVGSRGAP